MDQRAYVEYTRTYKNIFSIFEKGVYKTRKML